MSGMDRDDMWQARVNAERGVRRQYAEVIKTFGVQLGINPNPFLIEEDRDDNL